MAASKGLHLILIMPDTMSVERRKIVTALGAEIKLTPGREGMKGAIDEAQRHNEHYGNAFIPQQFENRPIRISTELQPLRKSGRIQMER